MSRASIAAVLCDLDGVLRHWDPDIMPGLDRAYGLAPGTVAATAFHPDRLQPVVTGQITDEQWRAAVAEDLSVACGGPERARALVAAWAAGQAGVDPEVLALLTAARRHVPVVLVTNATTRVEADLARLGLDDVVDAVVNSARVGVAKPDREIYLIAARRAGAPPGKCLFVDDTAVNVDGALAVGMVGLHYRGPDGLRAALASLTA
jgi:putative hydrolase of the HAD superfamily